MTYQTFTSVRGVWRVHEGIGAGGRVLAERRNAPGVLDLSAADRDRLWVLLYEGSGSATSVARIGIPGLEVETFEWAGGRLGAIASSSSGDEAVVLELPGERVPDPTMHELAGFSWRQIRPSIRPDISSKLAWLDGSRIVYESSKRTLVLFDLATGSDHEGPEGRWPASARAAHQWYAIVGTRLGRFASDAPLPAAPDTTHGFDVREPTSIRATADARVLVWTEPRPVKRSKGFVQERGHSKRRFKELDAGIGTVLGPSFCESDESNAAVR